MYAILQNAWWFVMVLGLLVTFHEFGHFIVARWVGVKVLTFSLGFGPRLFGRRVGDTDYRVSAIPFGGYVRMFGDDPHDTIAPEDRAQAFVHKSLWQRTLIVVAGPGFNFLLSYLIFSASLAAGTPIPIPTFAELSPTVDAITANSPAARAGLRVGDLIVSIDDRTITRPRDVAPAIAAGGGHAVAIDIIRHQAHKTFVVTPERLDPDTTASDTATATDGDGDGDDDGATADEPVYVIGIEDYPPVLTYVLPEMPAHAAGMEDGDRILTIQGEQIHTWSDLTRVIKAHPGTPLATDVERDGARITLTITPETHPDVDNEVDGDTIGKIGVMGHGRASIRSPSPLMAIWHGLEATWQWSTLTVVSFYKMVTGAISADNVGGPIMIANASGEAAKQGVSSLLFLAAVLSINLGILNLLPIPMLDGGHLFFFACEAVLRRPLGIRQQQFTQNVGFLFLVSVMAFAFFNDIQRLLQ